MESTGVNRFLFLYRSLCSGKGMRVSSPERYRTDWLCPRQPESLFDSGQVYNVASGGVEYVSKGGSLVMSPPAQNLVGFCVILLWCQARCGICIPREPFGYVPASPSCCLWKGQVLARLLQRRRAGSARA